jgi:putative phage-type endonuclease
MTSPRPPVGQRAPVSLAEMQTCGSRDAWLAVRQTGLGSSDAPVVLGLDPRKSPLQLWLEKTGQAEPDAEEREYLEWGLRLQPAIAAKYRDVTGYVVREAQPFTVWRRRDQPWMMASLDAEILGPAGPGSLEIKTTAAWHAEEWAKEPPEEHQVQLAWQLAVTGYGWGAIAVLIGGQRFRRAELARHERFIAGLYQAMAAFWHHVQTGTPPPVDASASTASALRALYPYDSGQTVRLPGEAIDWDAAREEADRQLATWTERKTLAENRIKAALGEATHGVLATGVRYTWKTSTRAAHVVPATTARRLTRRKGQGS